MDNDTWGKYCLKEKILVLMDIEQNAIDIHT